MNQLQKCLNEFVIGPFATTSSLLEDIIENQELHFFQFVKQNKNNIVTYLNCKSSM